MGDSFTTKYNYFIGEEAQYWASGVQAAKELTLEDLYPGIDLRLYSTSEGAMEFDWVLEPGADFSKVKMQFSGQDRLDVDQAGNLQVGLHFADVKFNILNHTRLPIKVSCPYILLSLSWMNKQFILQPIQQLIRATR